MHIELPLEFMAGLIGIQPGDLSNAIKKDSESEELKPLEEIQEFLTDSFKKKFSDTRKNARDEGYGRGKKESLTTLEKQLAEEWGVEAAPIQEMATAWAQAQSKPSGGKLTPEAIKASEIYVNDLKTEIAKRTALEEEFEQFKTTSQREQTLHYVTNKAKSLLEAKKFALPENEKIRENSLKGFIHDLTNGREFKIDGDNIQVLDNEGHPLRNDLMNEVSFPDLVATTADGWYEPIKDDGRKGPGANSQPPGGGGGGGDFPVVTNTQEFFSAMEKLETLEQKQAFKQHYEKQLATGFS